jgi:hypothetical protein
MKTPKNAKKYYCEICDFTSNKLSEYDRHNLTKKHKMAEYNQIQPEKRQKTPEEYSCECGKVYLHRASLYNHKKKCTYIEPEFKEDENLNNSETNNIIKTLVDQNNKLMETIAENEKKQQEENQKLQSQIIEAVKEGKTINNINNVSNNVNNVNYSINVFLNDQCKDAMSLTDFIETIKYQLEDLENVGRLGYVDGISKLFIENLSGMEVTKRPIHCTDLKRKSLYIKNNDEWTKDNNNTEMRKAINKVANNNMKNIDKWRDANPEHHNVGSGTKKKQYLDIVTESSSFATDDNGKKGDKIIKNISDVVSIDREMLKSGELES